MRRTRAALGLAAFAVSMTGCVMPDQMARMQKDMGDVQQRLRQVQNDQREALERVQDLQEPGASANECATREELANLAVRLEQIARQSASSEARIGDVDRRLDRMSQDLQQARDTARRGGGTLGGLPEGSSFPGLQTTGVMPEEADYASTGGGALPDPESLYNTAYADFSKGNFALAVSGFEEYQQRFPSSAQADNALYWIGECHFSQGNFPTSIEAFDRLLDRYPKSDKAAAANLKKALGFMEQNQIGSAIVQLRYVVTAFPGSDESRIARDKLTSLGASPN